MNQDYIRIRNEKKEDYRIVEELTREAFWNHYGPGCDEHYLVHIMREADAFVQALDLVAEYEGKIIGNIMYTKALVVSDEGTKYPVLTFGPLSVLPSYQGCGIGRMLIKHSKKVAKELGYNAILIMGDPEFYKRTGFVPAEQYSIGTSWDTYAAALIACELVEGALSRCTGQFYTDDIYNLDQSKVEAFDRHFPPKEKHSGSPSQIRFDELVQMSKPRV